MKRLYNNIQYVNDNTNDYLFRFLNAQKVNEVCNVTLITRGIQERQTKIIFPYQTTGFYFLQENYKKGRIRQDIKCSVQSYILKIHKRQVF